MAKKHNQTVLDSEGVEIGTEMNSNETIEKLFVLSRKTNWPLETVDGVERPVQLKFKVIIDMKNISYQEILDDAIRTKVITLQNALRGTGKNQTPFEVLQAMSKEPLHRHYDTMGVTPENPEKEFQNTVAAISNLTPEMRQKLMAQLAAM